MRNYQYVSVDSLPACVYKTFKPKNETDIFGSELDFY